MAIIARLPQDTINRIAAGEVVERPASAVKELVENALDAGARDIKIRIELGGLSRILIEDDGSGMDHDDLRLSVERHATSKLKPQDDGEWDLLHITSLGFRGEALPSIGSVARLEIISKTHSGDSLGLRVEAGKITPPFPAALGAPCGTRIEVRDLFYAVPARLKFMKSERAETMAVVEEVKRQAMAHPNVAFLLETDGRRNLRLFAETDDFEGRLRRLSALLGQDFAENALLIDQDREGVRLSGYAGLPTFSRGNAGHQYLFVNNRPVRDKLLAGALRAAYADFLARDRHPLAALFIDIDPQDLDVNVHPAKAEVRFKDPNLVRGLMIGALKHALASAGHRASTHVAKDTLAAFSVPEARPYQPLLSQRPTAADYARLAPLLGFESTLPPSHAFAPAHREQVSGLSEAPMATTIAPEDWPLGAAVAQVHETYIVAQTPDGIVLIDQHAAHERLVYEGLKSQIAEGRLERQALLIPEIVDLEPSDLQRLLSRKEDLDALGLALEAFGPQSVLVREIPALLGDADVVGMVRDLADEIAEHGEPLALKERLAELCGDYACRHSVRSGRRLRMDEMNTLLRQMEATPHSGQCNHGRPTYVKLALKDIEKLFGRR